LRAALLTIDETTLKGKRDRALLLLGFAGAFRRGELAALDVEHLTFDGRGLTITLPHSKTDQEGAGRKVAIPYVRAAGMCAARAVRRWLDAATIGEGPVFRTFSLPRGRHAAGGSVQAQRIDGRDVARILQRSTARAQLEGNFSAHSLRAGFITSAAQKKIPEVDVQRVSGHRSVATLRGYVRRATIFEDSPLTAIIDAP
jgi:integrase